MLSFRVMPLLLIAVLGLLAQTFGQFPVFPSNIVIFPERDFVSLDSFVEYVGQGLTVEVSRTNVGVIGSATGVVSGGDVAFEINHPGALCWGDGGGLQVTPDIQAFDTVTIKRGDMIVARTTAQNGFIISTNRVDNTVTATGFVDETIPTANIEVGIVNPDFRTTTVARRDARAIVGDLAANVGYTSNIVVTGTTFVATFNFDDAAAAEYAMAGAFSLSMWEFTDAAGNGQGLTISEFGEVGGPYSALCPASATSIAPLLPVAAVVAGTTLKWSPAQNVAGAQFPLTGYSVNIIKQTTPKQVFGYEVDAATTQIDFLLTSFQNGDVISIRNAQYYPGQVDQLSAAYTKTFTVVNSLPTLTASPASSATALVSAGVVTLSAPAGIQIAYTFDNVPLLDVNGKLTAESLIYTTGIPITGTVAAPTVINAVAFNTLGDFSAVYTGQYTAGEVTPVIAATVTTINVAKSGDGVGVTVSWIAPEDLTILSYGVKTYNTIDGLQVGNEVIVGTLSATVTGLTVGTSYQFTVTAFNTFGPGAESAKTAAFVYPAPSDVITITRAQYAATDFRVRGTGNQDGAIVTLHRVNPDLSVGFPLLTTTNQPITGVVTGCIAGACVFEIRNRANNPANPGQIYVVSSFGGIAGPVSV